MLRQAQPHLSLARASGALCLAALVLAGCSDRDYYKNPPTPSEPLLAVEPAPPPPVNVQIGTPLPPVDAPVAPTPPDITMDPRHPQDKTDKADIYWKFVYLAGTEGARRPPEALKQEIAKTLDDPAKDLCNQIVRVLERANDAYVARQRPGSPGTLTDDLPWGSGRPEFEKSLGTGIAETGPPLSNERRKKQLQDFNALYQLPPEMVRTSSIEEAKMLIEELRQMLNADRKRDHDFLIEPRNRPTPPGLSGIQPSDPARSGADLVIPPP